MTPHFETRWPKIPQGEDWTYEIKLDGYRLEAVKNAGNVAVYSRRKNILNEIRFYRRRPGREPLGRRNRYAEADNQICKDSWARGRNRQAGGQPYEPGKRSGL